MHEGDVVAGSEPTLLAVPRGGAPRAFGPLDFWRPTQLGAGCRGVANPVRCSELVDLVAREHHRLTAESRQALARRRNAFQDEARNRDTNPRLAIEHALQLG